MFRNSTKDRNAINLNICSNLKLGNKITSSRSKIKKMRAITKKRIEKGSRPSLKVENPHSKGERNSRPPNHFLEARAPAKSKIPPKIELNKNTKSHIKINKKPVSKKKRDN